MIIDMSKYTGKMVTDFEKKYGVLNGTAKTIAKENVFSPSKGKLLNAEMAADFHTFVVKGLFASMMGKIRFPNGGDINDDKGERAKRK